MRYVALLRGVNVGKSARVPMKELKSLLDGLGGRDVITYLNSGNAVFDADLTVPELARAVEAALERAFGQKIPALIKTAAEIAAIAAAVPHAWENSESEQTYVAYLFSDVDEPGLVDALPVRREFLSIFYTPGAVVWNIKRENYHRSHIAKIVGHSAYARMTTRNINTARALAELGAKQHYSSAKRSSTE